MKRKKSYIYIRIFELEIPRDIKNQKEQILKDLKEAFEESLGNPFLAFHYKDKYETCKIDLEYNGEII